MNQGENIKAFASRAGVPYIDIDKEEPDGRCLNLLKEIFARNYLSIPVRFLNGGVLVAMSNPLDMDMRNALNFHMGKEVFPAVAEEKAILKAINRYYSPDSDYKALEEVRSGHTISVISNKGGVGKTHISINLAKIIRNSGKKVLLVDTDLGNADISNKMAVFPEYTLHDFFLGERSLKDVIIKTPLGFDLIGGASGEFRLANLNYVQRSKFIRQFDKVSKDYDFTIFDLSAGISMVVMDFALATDEIVIVTTPQDIIAGYACIKASFYRFKTIEEKLINKVEGYEPRKAYVPWVVMNQVSNLKQAVFLYNRICQIADEKVNNMETIFNVKPAYLGGVIYDKETLRKAETKRQPLSCLYPNSKLSQCLMYLGKNIMKSPEERDIHQRLKGGFRRFSLVFGLK
ncbi:MAG: AAA family ATPase [Thermodesulfobacteriota bacterium]|nr:AAA family ATPase [Thermodesulfobacteriota bacterium]